MGRTTENQVKHFDRYIKGLIGLPNDYNYKDKPFNIRQHIAYMLNRTQSMFKWSGLPDTIPERVLELFLQTNGNVCFYKHDGNVYVFTGGLGGEPDVYYMPTIYTIANPALNISKSLKIDVDCVVMPNDSLYLGLIPLFSRYATGLTENELSMYIAMINTRFVNLISAPDDRTEASAQEYINKIIDGDLSVIGENGFFDGVRSQPYAGTANNHALTNLIEAEQYLKASWYNELGLNANYNMKRESLNSSESQLNNDALLPLVDNMLKSRQTAAEKVNTMFDLNISVSLASSWEDNEIEIDMEQGKISDQTETETGTETDTETETETEKGVNENEKETLK